MEAFLSNQKLTSRAKVMPAIFLCMFKVFACWLPRGPENQSMLIRKSVLRLLAEALAEECSEKLYHDDVFVHSFQ